VIDLDTINIIAPAVGVGIGLIANVVRYFRSRTAFPMPPPAAGVTDVTSVTVAFRGLFNRYGPIIFNGPITFNIRR